MGVDPSQSPPGTLTELVEEDDIQEDSSEENWSMLHNFHVYHGCTDCASSLVHVIVHFQAIQVIIIKVHCSRCKSK